jgi:FixJ family two-component response regulator
MNDPEPIVFVVDDDRALSDSLACLLDSDGLKAQCFHSAEEFLATYCPDRPGCLLLDIRMEGMSGMDLLSRLEHDKSLLPVIIMTGHGDIPMTVQAMKGGVIDFLEKPVQAEVLLQRIHTALAAGQARREESRRHRELADRMAKLTPRERQVLELLVTAKSNKQIAAELGVRVKTVEVHRKNVLHKMEVRSAVELVQLVLGGNSPPPAPDRDGPFGYHS